MSACRYGISLLVFNLISHEWDIKLNTRREIPYLQAPMYYPLYVIWKIFNTSPRLRKQNFLKTLCNGMHFKSPAFCFSVDRKHFENLAFWKQSRHDSHVISLPDFSPLASDCCVFTVLWRSMDRALVPDLYLSEHEIFATYTWWATRSTVSFWERVLNL